MDNIFFSKSFNFRTITLRGFRRTDNSSGISSSFFAKMRRGTGRIVTLSGEELSISEGDVFYLPKGLKYNSYWSPDSHGITEWDSYAFEFLPLAEGERFVMQKLSVSPEDLTLLDSVKKENSASPESVGYLYLFASKVLPTAVRGFDSPEDKLIEKATRYISKNLEFKVPELARHCSMSESSLFALFREHLGKTPVEVKQELQIERAVSLLKSSDLSLDEISSLSGFHSTPYFRKIFKEIEGVTPSQKRKEIYMKNTL